MKKPVVRFSLRDKQTKGKSQQQQILFLRTFSADSFRKKLELLLFFQSCHRGESHQCRRRNSRLGYLTRTNAQEFKLTAAGIFKLCCPQTGLSSSYSHCRGGRVGLGYLVNIETRTCSKTAWCGF